MVSADDHPLKLNALEKLFHTEKEFEVLARCTNGIETLQTVCKHQSEVLTLNIRMPKKVGLGVAVKSKKKGCPC